MSLQSTQFPPLPSGFRNGAGFVHKNKVYVGLGSLGCRWLQLDTIQPNEWVECAKFPGVERTDPVCVPVDGGCYIFSGAGIVPNASSASVLEDGYFYNAEQDSWHLVTDDTPVGLLGGAGIELLNKQLVLVGGYNKSVFDRLMQQLNDPLVCGDEGKKRDCLHAFMDQPIESYAWNDKIYRFDVQTKQWLHIGDNPFEPNCGAGVWRLGNTLVLIEGEVKPGLRSLKSKLLILSPQGLVDATELSSIVEQDPLHEGLAGAYCAELEGRCVVLGGAYFIGSQSNYHNGQHYSHQGLTKTYATKIWQLRDGKWRHIGDLAKGKAYGVCLSVSNGVVLIGGEDETGKALTECELLSTQ